MSGMTVYYTKQLKYATVILFINILLNPYNHLSSYLIKWKRVFFPWNAGVLTMHHKNKYVGKYLYAQSNNSNIAMTLEYYVPC